MAQLAGRVAFITGAASGIGVGLAKTLAAAGMKVAIADIRGPELQATAAKLSAGGATVVAIALDVTDRTAWPVAVERVERELGKIHVLCSNAGVNFVGPTHSATEQDWDFCLGVNVGGAVNAIRNIVPRMIEHGAGGHVVITSSVAGLYTNGGAGVYATSKFALIGLAESLRADVAKYGIGVSVVCPGPVKSELFESTAATRPKTLAATGSVPVIPPGVSREETPIFATALTPEDVGRHVLRGIQRNDLYIMTHPEIRAVLEARAAAQLAALPKEPADPKRIDATRPLLDASRYATEAAKDPP
jgi:NAD(P)-dependent dehydrogenase (short-subunit alcohol dehydrogenase family)